MPVRDNPREWTHSRREALCLILGNDIKLPCHKIKLPQKLHGHEKLLALKSSWTSTD